MDGGQFGGTRIGQLLDHLHFAGIQLHTRADWFGVTQFCRVSGQSTIQFRSIGYAAVRNDRDGSSIVDCRTLTSYQLRPGADKENEPGYFHRSVEWGEGQTIGSQLEV